MKPGCPRRTGDGLTLHQFDAGNRADHLLQRFGIFFLHEERIHRRFGGPFLPAQIVGADEAPDRDRIVGDKDLLHRNLDRGRRFGQRGQFGRSRSGRRLHRAHEEYSANRRNSRH